MKGSYSGASAGRYGGYGGNFAVIVVDFGIVPYHVPTRGAIWSQYFGVRLLKFRTRTGFTTGTVLKIARLIQFFFKPRLIQLQMKQVKQPVLWQDF